MNVMKQFKKLGIAVAMSSMLALVAPVMMPVNATTMVSAATVKLNKKELTMIVGKSQTLKVTGSKEKVKWSSSDKNVVTVSSKGKVTAKAFGEATVTAVVGKKKLNCKVTVKQFEEETLDFECGAGFVIPKGWKATDQAMPGAEIKIVMPDENAVQYVILMVAPNASKVSGEDFIAEMKAQVTSDALEKQLEAQFKGMGNEIDLKNELFEVEGKADGDFALLTTYAQYSVDGKPAIGLYIYDVSDGNYTYQIAAHDFALESNSDIKEVGAYMIANLTTIPEE